jgi:hypothetical protein
MGKKVSYWAYADAFNANEIALDTALLQKYQPLQGRSVEHWVLKFNKEGMAGLIDGWTGKARKDVNVFTSQPALEKTTIAILLQRPTITMKTMTDRLKLRQLIATLVKYCLTPHRILRRHASSTPGKRKCRVLYGINESGRMETK